MNLVSSPCVRYTLLLACAEIELALNWLGSIDPGVDTRRLARSARGFPPVQAAHRSVPTSLSPPNLGALGLNGSLAVVAVGSAGLVGVDMFTRYLVRLVAVQLFVGLGLLPRNVNGSNLFGSGLTEDRSVDRSVRSGCFQQIDYR